MKKHKIKINNNECIGCGLCKRDCPADNIAVADNKAVIKTQNCIKCGHCVAVCPKAAISITGFDESPIEIDKPTVLNPQQLLDAIRTRRSIRQFKNQPIPAEVIAQIIEAGRFTPTGENAQGVSYIVLQKDIAGYEKIAVQFAEKLLPLVKLISPAAKQAVIDEHFFFKKAPVALLVVSKNETDAALAASNMELMAEAHGLGVLYSGFFVIAANYSRKLRKVFALSHGNRIRSVLVLGYPNVKYCRTAQKDAAVIRYL